MDINIYTEQRKPEVEKQARSDAIAREPRLDAINLTPAETSLIEDAKKKGRQEIDRIGNGIRDTHNAAGSAKIALKDAQGRRQQAESASPPTPNNLEDFERDLKHAETSYNAFKEDNNLSREPTGDDRVAQIMWAAFVVLAESVANSYFYAPISEFGFLGGAFTAFFVSLINVAFAFIGGVLGLKYLIHVEPLKKLWGVLASLLCLFICSLVVIFSALYRGHVDALRGEGHDIISLTREAWHQSLISIQNADFWALVSSLESFLLVLIGLLCAIIGFWKGWAYDDPYPGYGAVYRRREKAKNALNHAHEKNDNKLNRWKQDWEANLRQGFESLEKATGEMRSKLAGIFQELQHGDQLADQIAKLAKILLGIYRDKNKKVRADPPPPYFEKFPQKESFEKFDLEIERLNDEAKPLKEEIESLSSQCNEELSNLRHTINHLSDVNY